MSRPYRMNYLVPTIQGFIEVSGWRMRCGAVVGRQLLWGGYRDDAWAVGDPASGGSIATGSTLGEAVRKYRAMVAKAGPRWPELLDQARARLRPVALAATRRHDQEEWSRYERRQMPYLGEQHTRSH